MADIDDGGYYTFDDQVHVTLLRNGIQDREPVSVH